MMEMSYIEKLTRYDGWANGQLFEALAQITLDERIIHLLGHHVVAKQAWLARVRGVNTSTVNLWPKPQLHEAKRICMAADSELLALAMAVDTSPRIIRYCNSRGETFENRLEDIIMHIVNHGTYHRGQLASAIKVAGGVPAATDYILYCRTLPTA